jgi:membrane associated rhomboid family serine protease
MLVTWILIATTAVVSWIAFNNRSTAHDLALWSPGVTRKHQYYRLLTYGFVHADMQHLLFNMITLFFFGRTMEMIFQLIGMGQVGYVLFYLSAVVISILPSYYRHRHDMNYISIGASGAVSAVLFAFILFQPWSMILVFFIPVPAILYAVAYVGYTVYMDRRGGDNINHSAHLWGAAYGVLFMLFSHPAVINIFLSQLLHPRF